MYQWNLNHCSYTSFSGGGCRQVVFLGKKQIHPEDDEKTSVCFPKKIWKGVRRRGPHNLPSLDLFSDVLIETCRVVPNRMAYGILDNLPAPFNGETFRSHQLVQPNNSHHAEVLSLATLRITFGVSAFKRVPS